MKNLFLILLSFLAFKSQAQDTMKVVQSDVSFQFGRDTAYDDGEPIAFSYKTAKFYCFTLNQSHREISLVWHVTDSTFKYRSGDLLSTDGEYFPEQKAADKIFILPDGATAAWSEGELLDKYGIWIADSVSNDSTTIPAHWKQTPAGKYILTRGDIMDGWSFYQQKATQPIPITLLFKSAGMRAAAEGRLNRPIK